MAESICSSVRNEGRLEASVTHQAIDRADHGIVFEIGGNHVVAGREQAGNCQIQRIRGVVAEA